MSATVQSLPKVKQKKFIQVVDYLFQAAFFLAGATYQIFAADTNPGSNIQIVWVIICLLLVLYNLATFLHTRHFFLLRSKLLLAFILIGIPGLLGILFHWERWYQGTVIADSNLLFYLIVAMAALMMANVYNSIARIRQISVAAFAGVIVGGLSVLVFNFLTDLGLETIFNVSSQVNSATISLTLAAILWLAIFPQEWQSRGRRRAIAIAGAIFSSVFLICTLSWQSSILLVLMTTSLLLLDWRWGFAMFRIGIVLIVVVMGGLLNTSAGWNSQSLNPTDSWADLDLSRKVISSSLNGDSLIFGRLPMTFGQQLRIHEPVNLGNELRPDYAHSTTELLDILARSGLLGLVAVVMFLAILAMSLRSMRHRVKYRPTAVWWALCVGMLMFWGIIVFQISEQWWAVVVVGLGVMANFLSDSYLKLTRKRTWVPAVILATIFAIFLVAFTGLMALSVTANWLYGLSFANGQESDPQELILSLQRVISMDRYQSAYAMDLAQLYTSTAVVSTDESVVPLIDKISSLRDSAIKLDPDRFENWRAELAIAVTLSEALPAGYQKDLKEDILLAVENIVRLAPGKGDLLFAVADLLSTQDRDLELRVKQIAYNLNSNVPEMILGYAELLLSRGDVDQAALVLQRALLTGGLNVRQAEAVRAALHSLDGV